MDNTTWTLLHPYSRLSIISIPFITCLLLFGTVLLGTKSCFMSDFQSIHTADAEFHSDMVGYQWARTNAPNSLIQISSASGKKVSLRFGKQKQWSEFAIGMKHRARSWKKIRFLRYSLAIAEHNVKHQHVHSNTNPCFLSLHFFPHLICFGSIRYGLTSFVSIVWLDPISTENNELSNCDPLENNVKHPNIIYAHFQGDRSCIHWLVAW